MLVIIDFIGYIFGLQKVYFQTNLERNPLNSSYNFLLDVNFENLTIGLHLIISSILVKFQEDQKSIIISSIKYLNFKFFWSKVMHKK